MKTSKFFLVIGAVLFSGIASAGVKVVAGDASDATKLCVLAATKSPHRLRVEARSQFLTTYKLSKAIRCNNEPIIMMTRYNDDKRVYKMLSRYERGEVKIYSTVASGERAIVIHGK